MAAADIEVAEFLKILEAHQKECERTGKYAEAAAAKKRLKEIRAHEQARENENLESRHLAERLQVEQGHLKEFESFSKSWDEKTRTFQNSSETQMRELLERHEMEQANLKNSLEDNFTLKPKYSKELLGLRNLEGRLAQQEEYKEAEKIKHRADSMQQLELENQRIEWRGKMASRMQDLLKTQSNELMSFKQKTIASKETQERQRQDKLKILLLKYQNSKATLSRQQKRERQRVARGYDRIIIPPVETSKKRQLPLLAPNLRAGAPKRERTDSKKASQSPRTSPRTSPRAMAARSPRVAIGSEQGQGQRYPKASHSSHSRSPSKPRGDSASAKPRSPRQVRAAAGSSSVTGARRFAGARDLARRRRTGAGGRKTPKAAPSSKPSAKQETQLVATTMVTSSSSPNSRNSSRYDFV